jgi:AcrR family transcriptional regulator
MTAALKKPERSTDTRGRLLQTALNLYAAEGIHVVSLRRISAEAGSKNSAAMHYHFQNRNGVLEALMAMIGRELKQISKTMPKVDAKDRGLRQACRDTLQPLVLLRTSQPWGGDAVRFLSRLVSEDDEGIAAMVNAVYAPFWRRLDKALAKELPNLSTPVRRLRLMFITTNVVHGMAEVGWLTHTPLGDLSHFDEDALLDHLVDYLIGGLEAPSFANQ